MPGAGRLPGGEGISSAAPPPHRSLPCPCSPRGQITPSLLKCPGGKTHLTSDSAPPADWLREPVSVRHTRRAAGQPTDGHAAAVNPQINQPHTRPGPPDPREERAAGRVSPADGDPAGAEATSPRQSPRLRPGDQGGAQWGRTAGGLAQGLAVRGPDLCPPGGESGAREGLWQLRVSAPARPLGDRDLCLLGCDFRVYQAVQPSWVQGHG